MLLYARFNPGLLIIPTKLSNVGNVFSFPVTSLKFSGRLSVSSSCFLSKKKIKFDFKHQQQKTVVCKINISGHLKI